MWGRPPQNEIEGRGEAQGFARTGFIIMSDYIYQQNFQTRSAELQDIAAMDRLAGELAPSRRLRRYAETSGLTGRPAWGEALVALVTRRHHAQHPRHAA
jgi:hypothetical protein